MVYRRCLAWTIVCSILSFSSVNAATPIQHVAIVGAQFGDEGKGALTDFLAEKADVVVRYNGGNNAGHTVIVGDQTFKFRSLPSGVIRPEKLNIIANGAIISPPDLMKEIETFKMAGLSLTPEQLLVSENAPLVLSLHKQIDQFREKQKEQSGQQIGTTGNGIGPAYEDKVARRAIRSGDLLWIHENQEARASLNRKIKRLVDDHYPELKSYIDQGLVVEKKDKDGNLVAAPFVAKDLYSNRDLLAQAIEKELLDISPQFSPYVAYANPVWSILREMDDQKKRILFEGGQAILLDIDHGTYPYVTSSNTLGTSALPGSGFSAQEPLHVLGVAKAYMTRVGNGPFPSRMEEALAAEVRAKGHEYGTVTGRLRDVGWLDLVALKQAVVVGGIHSLALTKVDILDGFKAIQVVTQYRNGNQALNSIPTQPWLWSELKPVYKVLPGWEKTEKITEKDALPKELLDFVKLIEDHVGVPVSIITTGPERDDKVILDPRFEF